MIKKLIISVLGLIFPLMLCAQGNVTIKGTVVDESGEPVIGAAVEDKAAGRATVTGLDGDFVLQAGSMNSVLHVSCIGYQSLDYQLDKSFTVKIVLKESALQISESVVTALGIKREAKALGYAVATVGGSEISQSNESNALAALSGKLAGVDITMGAGGPSGSTSVIIRGISQLKASNQPLYVIDGMPVDNTEIAGADEWGGYDYGDVLSSINPGDIESISVLKGPSASALYGSRASNGVVLITTKSATKRKDIGVEVTSQTNLITLLTRFDDYQQIYGQGEGGNPPITATAGRKTSQSAWGARLDPNLQTYIFNGTLKPYSNVKDNVMSFFRTGVTTTNQITIDKASDEASVRFSYTDMRNWDIVPSSDMFRQTFSVKAGVNLTKRLHFSTSATYTDEHVDNRQSLSDSPSNIGLAILGLAPNFDQRYLSEGYRDEQGRYVQWNNNRFLYNPYWVINEMSNESSRKRLIAQVNAEVDFTDWLKFTTKAGLDHYTYYFQEYKPLSTPRFEQGQMRTLSNTLEQWNIESILRFNKRFGDFDVSALVGGNILRYNYDTMELTGQNEIVADIRDITNYTAFVTSHGVYRKGVNSWFTQVSIGWKEILYLDATLRNDITSTLHPDNRSYYYPSVSGSFIFSNLMGWLPWMSFGKLRASWAQVGGDTDPYKLNLLYGTGSYSVNGVPFGSVANDTVPYAMLKPTRTNSFEVGLETRLLNDRISMDLTWYNQITIDQILQLPVSRGTGFDKAMVNAGRIDNKGIELQLTLVPVKTRDFSWTITNNLAHNRNKIVSLHEKVKELELAEARWCNTFIYASEGAAYGSIVGQAFARTENGDIIFKNGLPTYTDDMIILGNGYHDFTLGIKNGFSYKRWWFSVLFDMKFGADIFSMSAMKSYVNGTATETLIGRAGWYRSEQQRLAAGKDASEWTPTGGLIGKGVKEVVDADGNVSYVPNDVRVNPYDYWTTVYLHTPEPFIYDASYVKLRDVYISYSLPDRWLAKTPVRKVTFSAYGRNLFILYSNLKNIDPESSYNVNNGMGLEYGSLPSRRTFGFGVDVKF